MQSRNVCPVFDTGTDVITGRKQKLRRCVQKGTSANFVNEPIALLQIVGIDAAAEQSGYVEENILRSAFLRDETESAIRIPHFQFSSSHKFLLSVFLWFQEAPHLQARDAVPERGGRAAAGSGAHDSAGDCPRAGRRQ